MKKIFIVGNWKCNPVTLIEAKELFEAVGKGVGGLVNAEVVICPPFLYLLNLKSLNFNLKLGGQDCFYEQSGAFTGEISPSMLKDAGCEYVILGHSERRKNQQETDEVISKKIISALSAGVKPIVCIDQISQIPKKKNIIIAYEPLHCIGNGNACDPKEAEEMRILIEKETGGDIPILYGGSVNSQNAKDYTDAGFSGILIGGASLKPDEFVKIAKAVDFSG